MYKEILERLIGYPQRGRIKVDFDLKKKMFSLSVPIFTSSDMPISVKKFVESRKNFTFKPHKTSYCLDGHHVLLVQEFPFNVHSLRQQVDEFWQLSKYCHRMLSEIAIEEKYKNALNIDSHFKE